MDSLEAENIRLRQEVLGLRNTVIELQRTIIKLLEEKDQTPLHSRSPLKNWVLLVDNPKAVNQKQIAGNQAVKEPTGNPLYQTAIHEAGHAVIAAYHGIKFKDVSIRPYGNVAGRMMCWKFKSKLVEQLKGTYAGRRYSAITLERKVKFEIYILYAAYAAQLHTGIDNTEGAAQDFEQIGDYGMAYMDPGPELDSFLNECLEHTKKLVAETWHRIETVATQLIQNQKITGREVFAIVGSDY